MALVPTAQLKWYYRSQFKRYLKVLINRFYDMMLFYTQDIQVVNFSQLDRGIVHIIISYNTAEGKPVKLEAQGSIGPDYMTTLEFIWQAMKRAIIEAPGDYSGPFTILALPLPKYLQYEYGVDCMNPLY